MPKDLAIPMAFPDYKARSDEINSDVPSGHAGILFADGATGMTLYYEYGRYDPPANKGLVRNQTIANAGKGGLSVAALKPAFRRLSQVSGHNGRLRAAWIEVEAGGFGRMKEYATRRMQANRDAAREAYSITTNNCCTFAYDVADAGGAQVGLPLGFWGVVSSMTIAPKIAELFGSVAITAASPIPNAFIDHLLKAYPGVEYQPKDSWTSIGNDPLAM